MHTRVAAALTVLVAVLLGPATVVGAATDTTKPPKTWDPRIREFVKFAEKDRGLKFDHPVAVRFLDDAAFVKALNAGDEPTRADRKQAEHDAAQLRAVGMIGPDVDLIGAQGAIDDTTTTGFYDPDTKTLYVRGRDLTDTDVKLTVVHELTHALQDQHFGLNRLDDRVRDSGEGFAENALVEGDAVTVENDYFFTLPQREQDAYNATFDDPSSDTGADTGAASEPDAGATTADAPVLDAFDSAPYDFGSQFVTFVLDDRGPKAADALFRTLPRSEEQIIDPVATHRREAPMEVTAPVLADDEKAVGDPDVWGAFSLYLMLAARIDRVTALEAANGWGGDSYRAFTRADGTECVRVAVKGDTPEDTQQIADALTQWAAQMPAGGVTTGTTGATALFTACDVGGVTSPDAQRIDDATGLLYDRNHFAQSLIGDGVEYAVARCAGAKMALDGEIVDAEWGDTELTTKQRDALSARVDTFVQDCGG
ncbi:MAG: DUF6782 family putative metallopeptidase [Acidimicrobiia bacterium]